MTGKLDELRGAGNQQALAFLTRRAASQRAGLIEPVGARCRLVEVDLLAEVSADERRDEGADAYLGWVGTIDIPDKPLDIEVDSWKKN